MERTQRPEDLIKRYLLGELSAAEQTALEDEYFLDRAKYDQLRQAEDDLIDGYTRGSLSPADRERFERAYLANPQRRRHVNFSRAFAQVLDEELAARSPVERSTGKLQIDRQYRLLSWWSNLIDLLRGRRFAVRLAFALAALFFAFGGMWFVIETSRLHVRLAEVQQEVEAQQQFAKTQAEKIADLETQAKELTEERMRLQDQLQATKQAPKEDSSTRAALASIIFPLAISVFRDSGQEAQTLIIPRGVEEVGLLLNLSEHKFPSYLVMLLRIDGKEMFSSRGVRPQPTDALDSVMVRVPARKFTTGDNVLSVSGISSTGEVETISKTILKVRRQ
jgi:anti-sigma factor RsiW